MPWQRKRVEIDGRAVTVSVRVRDGSARIEGHLDAAPAVGSTVVFDDGAEWQVVSARQTIGREHEISLVARAPESPEPEHVGGGVYELPNGERVRGKAEAFRRFADLPAVDADDETPEEDAEE